MPSHLSRMSSRLLLLIAAVGFARCGSADEVFHHEMVLGTSMELRVIGASHEQAVKAESAALAEIDRLAKILSSYDGQSEVSRWLITRGEAVPVSAELAEMLTLFDDWRLQTHGALNPAAAAAAKLWRTAETRQQMPSAEVLAQAMEAMAQPHWRLDGTGARATHLSEVPLVFNSLTKSFIIQHAADAAMKAAQPAGLVLNIGGDILLSGAVRESVAIADPIANADNAAALDHIVVTSGAVATSGSYRRGYDIQGRHYSHILDPRTAQTADAVLSATVVAADACTAGALATAMCVLSADEAARVAARHDAEYLIVQRDGARVQSAGWSRLQRPLSQPLPNPSPHLTPLVASVGMVSKLFTAGIMLAALPAPAAPVWDERMELVISLELARVQDQRYRRPYVAVWIEDKDKFPVRTLALWYQKPRWLPDLKMWSKGDQLRKLAAGNDLAASVSSATRAAGRYTLKWDGKDDQGVPVKPGSYTVHIEAAREHGTYQLMKKEIDFSGTATQCQLEANTEVSGATLDYRAKPAATR